MRTKLCSVLCLFALLLFLPVSASANSLPSSSVYVKIAGSNNSITHVALLGREAIDEASPIPPEAIVTALPDGWYVCDCGSYIDAENQVFLWTAPFPSPFRVALLYENGSVLVTDEAVRTRSMQTFTVDAQTGAITTLPSWVGLVLQFACTCSVTLVIEAVVLLLFRFSWRENWKPFLLVNLATQVLMTLTFGRELVNSGGYGAFILVFLIELIIFIIEALAYARLLHGYTRQRRVAYAFIANLLSFVFGILCIAPVYSNISGLM